jgi:hypothetical protein
MKFSKPDSVPEHELTQYLLGKLHGEECERLDELSIADDEFAERLCAAENDLVDAYVRNQLRGDALQDFESHYLATDVRRQKVSMARTIFLAGTRQESSAESVTSAAGLNRSAPVSPISLMLRPRMRFAWVSLAAVLVLSFATAWLAVQNHRIRQQDRASLAAKSALEEQLRQLRTQVPDGRVIQNSPAAAAEDSGAHGAGRPVRLVSSIFLLPPTRGAATIPEASIPEDDRWFRLQLALESDDFLRYQVDLLDLGSNKYVWDSGPVKSVDVNHRRALSLVLPVGALKRYRYAAEVSGVSADGRHEVLGSYVFRIDQAASRQDGRR